MPIAEAIIKCYLTYFTRKLGDQIGLDILVVQAVKDGN